MRPYKVVWKLHKWIGIVLALALVNVSVTGLLLLEKKDHEWIQPATRNGQEGSSDELISMQRVFAVVLDCNHPHFQSVEGIDRVDFRPDKRVYKVRSKTGYAEIQVDAITGDVLNMAMRHSDLFEKMHDGSFFGDSVHGKLMPLVAVANILLVLTGLYLWLDPKLRKRKVHV